jgi:F-type H+-transporting ATPase subunit delta
MSAEDTRRVAELDAALDRTDVGAELSDELFGVVDLLQATPALRRGLTDPSTPDQQRQQLARGLLAQRLTSTATELVTDAAGLRLGLRGLTDALERQAVRAVLKTAETGGLLDEVEDQLFRFGRMVEADSGLRGTLTDRTAPLPARQKLAADLLADKATAQAVRLAQRAVIGRDGNFFRTLDGYVDLAAAMRNRVIATVRAAQTLDDGQLDRLQRALAHQIGRPVAVQLLVEPGLLGGIRVEVGDEVIDGSMSGRLADVGRQFESG